MSDLIDRQAAIDALERTKEKDPKGDIACFYNTITDNKIAVIEALPSASPKRCADCENLSKTQLLIPQPEQRWIPVTEELPREYERVIGYMAWKAMTAIEYQHGRWYSIDHLEPLPDEAVSHWMPLPKPPKEGDE